MRFEKRKGIVLNGNFVSDLGPHRNSKFEGEFETILCDKCDKQSLFGFYSDARGKHL